MIMIKDYGQKAKGIGIQINIRYKWKIAVIPFKGPSHQIRSA
jgi:hypothetical protein